MSYDHTHDRAAGRDHHVITEPAILELHDGPMLVPVLHRVVSAVAAQAGVDLDRLADLGLVADILAAQVGRDPLDHRLRVEVAAEVGAVVLRVGPLAAGSAARLRANCEVPAVGPVLERLAGDVRVEPAPDGEFLRITVGEGPRDRSTPSLAG
ncbi:MAG: hypothetical protein U0Y82_06070 [Thermoleophilia bacterium]